jgi:hypothetical protein
MSWVEMVKKGSTIPDLHHLNLVRVVCYWATLTLFSKQKQTWAIQSETFLFHTAHMFP